MEQTFIGLADLAEPPLTAPTVCLAFQRIVHQHADRVGLRTIGGQVSLTWAEVGERVAGIAAGLAGLGVRHGDSLATLLPNTVELHLVDYAAVHLGAVPFTIYNSSAAQQIEYQLKVSGARVMVTQTSYLPQVLEAKAALGDQLEHLIVIDGPGGTMTLEEVEGKRDPGFDFDAAWQAVTADDLATMIFTSGTTGPPKAAQWSHRTIMAQQRGMAAALPLPTEGIVSYLPMAHAGGRILAHYMALTFGATITVCPDIRELPAHLADVHPDVLFSVPRLWEKLQVGVEAMINGIPDPAERAAAQHVVEVGLRRVRALDQGDQSVSAADAAELATEHEEGLTRLAPIVARLGLDRIKAAFIGGAPAPDGVVRFFRAIGVPLLEAYGLTEGSLNIFNRVTDFKLGTAGKPLPGVEAKVASDGELLIRSEMTMAGYRGAPELNAQTLDSEGWLHTGDIAAIDDDGWVSIIDRKKEIIINGAGKNMSPAVIESAIKSGSSLIGQVVSIGDRRRYVTALITLDPEAAAMRAERLGVDPAALAALARHPAVAAEVQEAVDLGNAQLNRDEQIKKYTILPDVWVPDSDVLTPTMKLKRRPIALRYAAEIEAMYAE